MHDIQKCIICIKKTRNMRRKLAHDIIDITAVLKTEGILWCLSRHSRLLKPNVIHCSVGLGQITFTRCTTETVFVTCNM